MQIANRWNKIKYSNLECHHPYIKWCYISKKFEIWNIIFISNSFDTNYHHSIHNKFFNFNLIFSILLHILYECVYTVKKTLIFTSYNNIFN